MRIQFDEATHTYTTSAGRRVPGIHEILGLAGALEGMPDNEEAKRRGQVVHTAIEYDLKGILDEASCTPQMMGFVRCAREAIKELGIEVKKVEAVVGTSRWGYATKVDVVGTWRTRPVVVNWKTGGHMAHYPIQLAAEAMCFTKRPRRIAVYLTDTGRFDGDTDWKEFTDPRDFAVWRAMLTVADWRKRSQQSARPRQVKEEKPEEITLPVRGSKLFEAPERTQGAAGQGLFG